jgi:CBS domain containing-hemolysin-like protein
MNKRERISVRTAMRTDVTFIDGSENVLDALRAMRDGQCTSLIVNKRSDHDEHGIVTLSDIAQQVLEGDSHDCPGDETDIPPRRRERTLVPLLRCRVQPPVAALLVGGGDRRRANEIQVGS